MQYGTSILMIDDENEGQALGPTEHFAGSGAAPWSTDLYLAPYS